MTASIKQRRGRAERWNLVLTQGWRADTRQYIRGTAAMFGVRLSPECVEDLVQEVLLRLWKSRAGDRLHNSPAYLRKVAANTTIDFLRKCGAKKRSARRTVSFDVEAIPWLSYRTPEEIVIARDEARHVLANDRVLRKKVEREIRRQHVKRPTHEKHERKRYEKRRTARHCVKG